VTSKDYLDHLAAVPLFRGCNAKELRRIAKAVDEVAVEDGYVLAEQDTTGKQAFVIVEGEVVVKRNGRKVATLGPGQSVGELALLDGGPRTATVVAAGPCELLVLGQREFSGLLDGAPGLARRMLSNLAARVRELDQRVYS
jgi:CRP-like cAMP-binding protein